MHAYVGSKVLCDNHDITLVVSDASLYVLLAIRTLLSYSVTDTASLSHGLQLSLDAKSLEVPTSYEIDTGTVYLKQ